MFAIIRESHLSTSVSRGSIRAHALLLVTFGGLAGFSADTLAQSAQPNTPLPTLPGLTALQQPVANAIDVVCPNLLFNVNVTPNANGTPIERLTNSCTAMVVTSAYLQGNMQLPANFDLKITNDQLRTGLQASAPVQMNAQKQISIQASKNNLLTGRLFDLRAGARGFSVSLNGMDMPDAARAKPGSETLYGATGGAAGEAPGFGGRWGGFVKIAGNWGKVDQTTLQDPYKYDSYSVLAGADYRVSDALVLGGAVSYEDTKSDFDNSLGNVKAKTWSVTGYGTYTLGKWYVDGLVQRNHMAIDLHISPNLQRLSQEIEIAIFRIVQECLTNVHRHSGSNRANIHIGEKRSQLLLTVRDYGKGISSELLEGASLIPASSGAGLRGKIERVRELGGEFQIQPASPGTIVQVVLPAVARADVDDLADHKETTGHVKAKGNSA